MNLLNKQGYIEGQTTFWDMTEPDKMIFLNGSKISFRCDCGCNVFKEISPFNGTRYKCNSCDATYTGNK